MINGSFGIGKTTVARLLRKALPGSLIYDPEWFGVALMRVGRLFRIARWQTDDFQHIPLWRTSVSNGVGLFSRVASGPVIVPMTFSSREYFDQVLSEMNAGGLEPQVFCLAASLETIQRRLANRRLDPTGQQALWLERRILECVLAHADSHFGESVDAEHRSPNDIAHEILQKLKRPSADYADYTD